MRRFTLLLLACSTAAAGCAGRHQTIVARYSADAPPAEGITPSRGKYGLFVSGQPEDVPPMAFARLEKGDPLGFRVGPDGTAVAVAGECVFPVLTEPCEWRLVPGTSNRLMVFADTVTSKVVDGTTTAVKWIACGVLIVGGVILIVLVAAGNNGNTGGGQRSLFGFGK